MEFTIKQAGEYFLKNDNYLIFSHSKPDGDTIGSAVALSMILKKLGKRTTVFCADPIPGRLEFILMGEKIIDFIPEGDYKYIGVDIASPSVLKGIDIYKLAMIKFDLVIDHHKNNTVYCENSLILSDYPAAGQIIAELVHELGVKLDTSIATALYSAISSDSGCFRFSSTMPSTHRAAAELLETGIDFAKINRLLFETKTKGQMIVEAAVYGLIEYYYNGRVAIVCLPDRLLESPEVKDEDTDGVVQIPRKAEGVEVSCVIYRRGDDTKISFRSNDYYDVSALAGRFGGGGHFHAAGCRLNMDAAEVKRLILDALKEDFDGD